MAPGIEGLGTTAYQAAHNQIRAHAKAYRYKYSGAFIIIFVKLIKIVYVYTFVK